MATTASTTQIREQIETAYRLLEGADGRIREAHHKDPGLCREFNRYGGVDAALEKARKLLDRKSYRVALAGMMKAGKSTLANALLRSPDLLPTGVDETTLTITAITSPRPDQQEGIAVEYLGYEDALRGVFQRGHYCKEFDKHEGFKGLATSGDAGLLRQKIEEAAKASWASAQLKNELAGFLRQLDKHRGRLGTTVFRPLSERNQFLAPTGSGDALFDSVGHILLVAKATLNVSAELLSGDGIEFVDLPGADSTNDRQKLIALTFLQDTDLLISASTPSGFRAVDEEVLAEFTRARGQTKDRVFFVQNRFDGAGVQSLNDTDKCLNVIQKPLDHVSSRYDQGNFFYTCALWSELERSAARGALSADQKKKLDGCKDDCQAVTSKLGDLGVYQALQTRYPGVAPRLIESLQALNNEGGVQRLRTEMIHYLKTRIERERLREVLAHLQNAERAVVGLVEPERAQVQASLASASRELEETGEYLDRVQWATYDALAETTKALALPDVVRAFGEVFRGKVKQLLARNNQHVDFRRIRQETSPATTPTIMGAVVHQARRFLADQFRDLFAEAVAGEVAKRYEAALGPLENPMIMGEVGRVIGRPGLKGRYEQSLGDLKKGLRNAIRLRAIEEARKVTGAPYTPPQIHESFDAIEGTFREQLTKFMEQQWEAAFKSLGEVLAVHVETTVEDFNTEVGTLVAEAKVTAKKIGATLPAELLAAKATPEERRRYRLVELVTVADGARQAVAAAQTLLA